MKRHWTTRSTLLARVGELEAQGRRFGLEMLQGDWPGEGHYISKKNGNGESKEITKYDTVYEGGELPSGSFFVTTSGALREAVTQAGKIWLTEGFRTRLSQEESDAIIENGRHGLASRMHGLQHPDFATA